MLRRTLGATSLAVLALVPEALQPLFAPGPASAPPALEDPAGLGQLDATDRQPVLVYDVSGGTLLGPVQSTVVVWSSGAVTYSRQDPFSEPAVGTMTLAPAALEGLLQSLEDAGTGALQDQWPQVADLPLNTVTVLGPTTSTVAHTFSYWTGVGKYAAVDAVLDRLTAEIEPVR